ncbi:hypothetical protein ABVT39_009845 [Epinephelus coioides]
MLCRSKRLQLSLQQHAGVKAASAMYAVRLSASALFLLISISFQFISVPTPFASTLSSLPTLCQQLDEFHQISAEVIHLNVRNQSSQTGSVGRMNAYCTWQVILNGSALANKQRLCFVLVEHLCRCCPTARFDSSRGRDLFVLNANVKSRDPITLCKIANKVICLYSVKVGGVGTWGQTTDNANPSKQTRVQ